MSRLNLAKMQFFRETPGLNLKINKEILEELGVKSVENKIQLYKFNWINHVPSLESTRIAKIMMSWKPRGHLRPENPSRDL